MLQLPSSRSRLATILSAVALLGLCATHASATDWPQWRGPERTAKSSETGIAHTWPETGPPLAWKATGLGTGYATVSIADGKIFTSGDVGDEQFAVALDQATGDEIWRTKIGGKFECPYGFSGARATPTVDGDRIYLISTDSILYALSAADGKVAWKHHLIDDFGGKLMNDLWSWTESPLVDGDKVVVSPGGEKTAMMAFDKATGEEIWRAAVPALGDKGSDGAGFSSIVVSHAAGVKQYVQLMGRGTVGIEAATGTFLWGYNKVANDVANIPTPVVHGDYVFTSTSYDTGSALLHIQKKGDALVAEEVYFHPPGTFQNHHGGFVELDKVIYAGHGHNKGFPIAIEMLSGKILWGPIRNEGQGSAAVAYVDGHLIYRYQSGHVVLVEANPKEYVEKGSFELPELKKESWPHPVIADGLLYLRENDNLWVYDLKPQPAQPEKEQTGP